MALNRSHEYFKQFKLDWFRNPVECRDDQGLKQYMNWLGPQLRLLMMLRIPKTKKGIQSEQK
eukprot:3835326-Amphidinium_carterae.1